MVSSWNRIALLGMAALCSLPGLLCAQQDGGMVRGLEARIMYEATTGLMARGKHDRALRRFDHIIEGYGESVYAGLARERKKEIRSLKSVKTIISPPARVGLVFFSTLYATWLGVGTGIIVDEPGVAFALGLIEGPVFGLLFTLERTKKAQISDGQASLLALGGAWGTWQGIGAAILADSGHKTVVGAGMGGGALGLLVSSAIVRRNYVSAGEATMVNFGGIWGTWFALSGARSMGVENSDALLGSALAGGNLGLLAMGLLSPAMGMSGARARLINLGGIVGTLYGLGTAVLVDVHHRARPTYGMMLAGGILGLGAGTYFTREYEATQEYFAVRESGSLLSAGRDGVAWGIPVPMVCLSPEAVPREKRRAPASEIRVELMRLSF